VSQQWLSGECIVSSEWCGVVSRFLRTNSSRRVLRVRRLQLLSDDSRECWMYRKQWLRSIANVSMVGKLLGKMKIPVAVAYSGYAGEGVAE